MDMKESIISSMYSLVVYPKIQDIMVTICMPLVEEIADIYGGGSLGTCFSSTMKVWSNWANLDGLNLVY